LRRLALRRVVLTLGGRVSPSGGTVGGLYQKGEGRSDGAKRRGGNRKLRDGHSKGNETGLVTERDFKSKGGGKKQCQGVASSGGGRPGKKRGGHL